MPHHHHHSHPTGNIPLNSIYIFSMVINLLFVIIEAGLGFFANSMGLLSDAGHNLGDVFSLLLAFIAFKLSISHSSKHFTYGYKKSSVLIALLNSIILFVAVGAIIIECIHKFRNPEPVNGSVVAWTAGIGILINGITAYLLSKQSQHDINTRGAFLHMLADTLVSVGVLISGVIIKMTGFTIIDPIISLVVAFVILTTTWRLLSESLRMSIDAVPETINIDEVKETMKNIEGITDVHHLHIWPISTTEIALTAHIKCDDPSTQHQSQRKLKEKLQEIGIFHSTIEIETDECHCGDCGY